MSRTSSSMPKATTPLTFRVPTCFTCVVRCNPLSVKAQPFAAQVTPLNGLYPLAVNIQDLDASGFVPPSNPDELPYYGIYRDSDYPNGLRQRRIYMKPNLG